MSNARASDWCPRGASRFVRQVQRPRQRTAGASGGPPPELVKLIDWATLEVFPPSFIDGAFAETQADLLFRVEIAGRDARLYVVFGPRAGASRAVFVGSGYRLAVGKPQQGVARHRHARLA
ncbi:MAG: Rpn family recombination-promoting nuclease/putative transposase [Myxococcales bacterium]|nr:Rpn family recombination-promoting nuclease/putative transposase [Myxococcales bacterium]